MTAVREAAGSRNALDGAPGCVVQALILLVPSCVISSSTRRRCLQIPRGREGKGAGGDDEDNQYPSPVPVALAGSERKPSGGKPARALI